MAHGSPLTDDGSWSQGSASKWLDARTMDSSLLHSSSLSLSSVLTPWIAFSRFSAAADTSASRAAFSAAWLRDSARPLARATGLNTSCRNFCTSAWLSP
ncbi:hypothetical protein BST61_g7698 [Cercospora zeina]